MSFSVYQCGSRTSLTLIASPSGAETTPTHANANTVGGEGSTRFESPSPIAQGPSFHSPWYPLPPRNITPFDGGGDIARPASQRRTGRRKLVSPLVSPSPDSGCSGELTQENVTSSTRCLMTSQGTSTSQEIAEPSNHAASFAELPQQTEIVKATDADNTANDDCSDRLQCSSIQIVMGTGESRNSAVSTASTVHEAVVVTDFGHTATADTTQCTPAAPLHGSLHCSDDGARPVSGVADSDSPPTSVNGPETMNSKEARALFFGELTSSSCASSVTSCSALTAATNNAENNLPVEASEQCVTDEQTPIKQSLSQIRARNAELAARREIWTHQHLMAVAFTPDSVRKHFEKKQQLSAKRLPSERATISSPGGSPSGGLKDKATANAGYSPQRIPSYLATPNLCIFDGEGFTPESGATGPRSPLHGCPSDVKAAALDMDDPESTPVCRFTGFPSPVKLSPIPTKGNQESLFAILQGMCAEAFPRRIEHGEMLSHASSARPMRPMMAAKKACDDCDGKQPSEDDFRPEYVTSSSSSCANDGSGGDKSMKGALLPKSSASSTAAPFSARSLSSCPASPLLAVPGQNGSESNIFTGDATGTSTSRFLNPADTTQPPVEGAEPASRLSTGAWSDVGAARKEEPSDSRQLSSVRNTSEHQSMSEFPPSWTALVAGATVRDNSSGSSLVGHAKLGRGGTDRENTTPNAPTPALSAISSGSFCQLGETLAGGGETVEARKPLLSPSLDAQHASAAKASQLYFSILPIPGRVHHGALRDSARGGNGASSLPEANLQPVQYVTGRTCSANETPSFSTTLETSVPDEASSPSKLFLDYYYSSSIQKKAQPRVHGVKKLAVSPTETDLSVSVPLVCPLSQYSIHHCAEATGDADAFVEPQRRKPQRCPTSSASGITFLETVSTIQSREGTEMPSDVARRQQDPVVHTTPSHTKTESRAESLHVLAERLTEHRERKDTSPAITAATAGLLKTEMYIAETRTKQRFSKTLDPLVERKWSSKLSGRCSLDTFL